MRLHRHDELVEAMARELCSQNDIDPDALEPGNCPYNDDEEVVDKIVRREPHFYKWRLFRNKATAALDALLAAVQEMGVGLGFVDVSGPSGLQFRYPTSRETPNTLIIQLEEKQP